MERDALKLGGHEPSPVENFSVFAGSICLRDEDADKDLDDFIQNDAERYCRDMITVIHNLKSITYPDMALGFAASMGCSLLFGQLFSRFKVQQALLPIAALRSSPLPQRHWLRNL